MNFNALVDVELERARSKFGPLHTAHEGYAVILEELDEFWDMVRLGQRYREPSAMLTELVQIAAMARRTAEDLELDSEAHVP